MDTIKHLRANVLGISQLDMAGFAGVSQATVSRWESGELRVTAEQAVKIERATKGAVTRSDLRPDLWPQSLKRKGAAA